MNKVFLVLKILYIFILVSIILLYAICKVLGEVAEDRVICIFKFIDEDFKYSNPYADYLKSFLKTKLKIK